MSVMAHEETAVLVVDSSSEASSQWKAALSSKDGSSSDIISVSSIYEIPPATPLRTNTVVSLENYSLDVISVSSVEEIIPAKRENIRHEVIHGGRNIEEICICCGSFEVHTQHPLFHGGMCAPCTEKFLERFFLCDADGSRADCTICCWGELLMMCDDPTCNRCFCIECLNTLVGPGTGKEVEETNPWICFLCAPPDVHHGLLKRKTRWRAELKRFYDEESSQIWIYQPLSPWEQKPIHVLSIFDDITKELKSLGLLGKRSGNGTMKYVDDVTNIIRAYIEESGPFDFIFGSTPPVAKSYQYPPAYYFYHYFRILQYGRPPPESRKPFFFMFLDNLVLEEEDRNTVSRFLQMEAVINYKEEQHGIIQNAVNIWSNIPSVNSKYIASDLNVDLFMLAKTILQSRIFSQRPVTQIKHFLAPLKEYFRAFP